MFVDDCKVFNEKKEVVKFLGSINSKIKVENDDHDFFFFLI